jgi:hypothetical protein
MNIGGIVLTVVVYATLASVLVAIVREEIRWWR